MREPITPMVRLGCALVVAAALTASAASAAGASQRDSHLGMPRPIALSRRPVRPGPTPRRVPPRTWGTGMPTVARNLSFNAPGEADVDPTTGRVYVANYGDNTVAVLDGRTDATIATIPVGNGPGGIVFDHGRVLVANSFDGTISVIDAHTSTVTKTINTGTIYSQQLAVDHRLRKLYVAVYRAPVLVYDLDTLRQIGTIDGDDTNFIALNERTHTLYVDNYDDATLEAVDTHTDRITNTVSVGPAASPDDCYETNSCVINPAGPDGIAINERTNRIYVDNVITGSIAVVNGQTNTVITTINQLPGQFWSAVDEDTNTIYSTNFAESTLSVLDGRTNTILGTVKLGDGFTPEGCFVDQATCTSFGASSSSLAFSARTGKLYVPNFGANTLVILNTRHHPQRI